ERGGKRLELFKEVVPRVARIAVLYEPTNPSNVLEVKGVQTAAAALKLTVQPSEVRRMNANEKRTVDFALRSRLPSVYLWSTAVSAGGLMAYGASLTGAGRDAARYVD